jgi:hypothetical protein
MANNAIFGGFAIVKFSGGTLVECTKWDAAPTAKTLDATTFDSGGWEEVKMGLRGWSGSFETRNLSQVNYLGTIAVGSFYTGTAASSLTPVYSGTVMVSDSPISVSYDALITLKHTFKGCGALTISIS